MKYRIVRDKKNRRYWVECKVLLSWESVRSFETRNKAEWWINETTKTHK